MKKFLFALVFAFSAMSAMAQYEGDYKIIFQVTSSDTTSHKALMKQLRNITTVAPQTQIEVVCHGPGLSLLVAESTIVGEKITEFIMQGIVFNACEFSMSERKVNPTEILEGVGYVTAGILEIVSKQQAGWHYIKAGF
jgi:intracellular sulfur oxidation DsrE/DsrF family protein